MTAAPWITLSLLAWLGIATYWDLRVSRVLPLKLLVAGILLSAGYVFWLGHPWLAMVCLLAVLASNSSRLAFRAAGVVLLAVFAGQNFPGWVFGWIIFWLFWEFRIWGGGDALLCIVALTCFPTWEMLYSLASGLGIVGTAILAWKHRRSLGARLKSVGTRALLKDWPQAQEMERDGLPATPGILLGVLIFTLLGAIQT